MRVIQPGREGKDYEAALARELLTNLEGYLARHVAHGYRAVSELVNFDRGLPPSGSVGIKGGDGVDIRR